MAQMTLTADPAEVHAALDAPWDAGSGSTRAMAAISDFPEFPVPAPIGAVFWQWYDRHAEDVIFKKRILVWTVELKVKHLKPLFEKFFGQHP